MQLLLLEGDLEGVERVGEGGDDEAADPLGLGVGDHVVVVVDVRVGRLRGHEQARVGHREQLDEGQVDRADEDGEQAGAGAADEDRVGADEAVEEADVLAGDQQQREDQPVALEAAGVEQVDRPHHVRDDERERVEVEHVDAVERRVQA
jgi:hypothetical protein